MTDECLELKNIKYKTMLLNGNNKQFNDTKSEKMSEIDRFLENERKMNRAEPWGKLDQTQKMRKIEQFISTFKRDEQQIDETEQKQLKKYLKECINKKRLQRVKDVLYDKEEGIILSIPNLIYNKSRQRYTLKRSDKRMSTLKSLGKPKKKREKSSKRKSTKKDSSGKTAGTTTMFIDDNELIPDKIDS
jgi:hypothetical protein